MNVHVLYDLAQQTQDFISFSWFPCVGALVCLLFAIIPWRRLQRSGSRKWALVYAWAMCVVTAWVVGGSFLSYYLDIQKYRKYRDWFHSVEYDTVEGRCVLSSSDSNPLGSDAPQVFRVDNKTFEYGLWSDLNHGITPEIIDPLQASGERIRVYYSEGLIFRIEQEKAAKEKGESGAK